jgi:hypothetical protein
MKRSRILGLSIFSAFAFDIDVGFCYHSPHSTNSYEAILFHPQYTYTLNVHEDLRRANP